ncbi:MAG TPA: Gfo/Idh/MocA family oxidoreductase [Verrucomicrobiota bacterium]|mgnify:CR=1 FL=1|nr:Gfo/Idh/MocA family oxidoreductase [Verrucomicrobiota bacterium]HRR64948.1 Gfo/Idh/MocA family oxidoreductase [Candidatus Paceibacterota bacterium]HOM45629.1 Gfo/Idh/MocA family oxidoreductase [Verrucomicrobiota bacterium]HOQ55989.1 Gfo/Idh/MocA family oxidoreductase [Verrucomicrobiota bacterium]HPC53343.1 Gfo/Idh/MocA family oxidoreductase [Verrucomicrobiota bacterium]
MNLNRRDFLKTVALGAAAFSLDARTWSRAVGANDDIRVAVIGFRGQGAGHIKALNRLSGVRVVAICDVDRQVLEAKARELGSGVQVCTDLRRVLDNKDVDAVSIATPNHWHALATVWACQAGKDVYVEKPASHNLFEGRKMVEAARKYKRIVQCGTQCRSSGGLQEAVQYVREGRLGRILLARGFCYKARRSIGTVDGPQPVPAYIEYDLWCGPAPNEPPRRKTGNGTIHYDWHWFWNYGNGDYGNQGPHQLDIARWFLGEKTIAPFTQAIGGRLGYQDSAETPNTLIVYHGYKTPLLFEVRGLPHDQAAQSQGWKMDNYRGVSIGNVIECEHGSVVVPSYTEAIIYDRDGKEITRFTGRKKAAADSVKTPVGLTAESGGHHGNWIAAVRSRNVQALNAEILEGHLSAGLVHTGNISYRLGAQKAPGEIRQALADNRSLAEAFDRMAGHLDANGVDLAKDKVWLGMPLKFDPRKERFAGNRAANEMLTRPYRPPFVVPAKV